ncbi:hypothetical protein [Marinobacter litoralis]|uniref:hypothetical protein n=1 Tax=Marinobacter litoralis TaxID=187981 RepID=UPI0018EC02C5|nr:hypothetical protein [Marinobacter litoralis]MBJ6137036.1 hypothetical protein [Marinobacter litoralis]
MFQKVIIAILLFSVLGGCTEPLPDDSAIAEAVSKSDDYSTYESEFIAATKNLLKSEQCSIGDFKEMGGWMKSTTTYKDEPVYFTYCGGMTISNRIYLDASKGETFR